MTRRRSAKSRRVWLPVPDEFILGSSSAGSGVGVTATSPEGTGTGTGMTSAASRDAADGGLVLGDCEPLLGVAVGAGAPDSTTGWGDDVPPRASSRCHSAHVTPRIVRQAAATSHGRSDGLRLLTGTGAASSLAAMLSSSGVSAPPRADSRSKESTRRSFGSSEGFMGKEIGQLFFERQSRSASRARSRRLRKAAALSESSEAASSLVRPSS